MYTVFHLGKRSEIKIQFLLHREHSALLLERPFDNAVREVIVVLCENRRGRILCGQCIDSSVTAIVTCSYICAVNRGIPNTQRLLHHFFYCLSGVRMTGYETVAL
jgi:hypothetical protein